MKVDTTCTLGLHVLGVNAALRTCCVVLFLWLLDNTADNSAEQLSPGNKVTFSIEDDDDISDSTANCQCHFKVFANCDIANPCRWSPGTLIGQNNHIYTGLRILVGPAQIKFCKCNVIFIVFF